MSRQSLLRRVAELERVVRVATSRLDVLRSEAEVLDKHLGRALAGIADLSVMIRSGDGDIKSPHELDVDDDGRLTLDSEALEIRSFDEKRRWLTVDNVGGRLLIALARHRDLSSWDSDELAKAIQQVKRSELQDALLGRGKNVRLDMSVRIAPMLAEHCRLVDLERGS